jgi:hypothetical protein
MRGIFMVVAGVVGLGFLAGCAGMKGGGGDAPFNLIINEKTPFYKEGPQQAAPPDGYMERGMRIRMLESYGQYLKIETVSGQVGYVASDACAPAPHEDRQPQAIPQAGFQW